MKQETNNEIDALLRRLGRQSKADVRLGEDHLDADELSSFAENALPSAARARYTEHIADCSRCRELVVQLSSSAGLVTAEQTVKVSEPSAVKGFLASLLSPMVLRYAVPALGVLVVMLIGFSVMRREPRPASVVQLREQEQQKTVAKAYEQPAAAPGEPDNFVGRTSSPAVARQSGANTSLQDQPAPPPNAPPDVSVTTEVKPATVGAATRREQEPVANEPSSAKKVAAASDETKTVEVQANKETIDNRALAEVPKETSLDSAKAEKGQAAAPAAATGSAPAKDKAVGLFSVTPQRARQNVQRDGADKKDSDDAETRSVAGRQFRKQGGVWVDTAYEAPRNPTTVTRGSEQFRALVADEPAIKTIADQLDGEIIVVWKGRVYKIR